MAVNKRDLSTLDGESGWPTINYAQEERNFQTTSNRAGALSIPRFKFTWLVEFQLSPRVLDNPITNLKEFMSDTGKLYTHLISIDHPSPTIASEKLRSYNKWITVPTKVEYPDATMTFHDDSTSVVQALWKEHLNFYTHQATIGDTISGIDTNTNLSSTQEANSYQFTDDLTATDGGEMRSAMGRRPSLGMRLKPNDGRHFFEQIIIYDLGTEPDAVNVYWYHNPMITAWNHDNLDKEDRTGNVRVSASFNYEGYYFTIGQNRGRLSDYIQHILGAVPSGIGQAPRKSGIARDGREEVVNRVVQNGQENRQVEEPLESVASQNFLTDSRILRDGNGLFIDRAVQTFSTVEPVLQNEIDPTIPNSLNGKQRDLDRVREEKNEILNAVGEGESDLGEDADKSRRLAELEDRETQLNNAIRDQKKAVADRTVVTPSEKSALDNTKASTPTGDAFDSFNSVPNTDNKTKSDRLIAAADNKEQLANKEREIAESRQRSADRFAAAGNTKQAQRAQEDANDANANAAALDKIAANLRKDGEAIKPKNQ
jgi:hypothetical protein